MKWRMSVKCALFLESNWRFELSLRCPDALQIYIKPTKLPSRAHCDCRQTQRDLAPSRVGMLLKLAGEHSLAQLDIGWRITLEEVSICKDRGLFWLNRRVACSDIDVPVLAAGRLQ